MRRISGGSRKVPPNSDSLTFERGEGGSVGGGLLNVEPICLQGGPRGPFDSGDQDRDAGLDLHIK